MLRDRAERAASKHPPHHVDGELDGFVRRNVGIPVIRMNPFGERQREHAIQFLGFHRKLGRIDHHGLSSRALDQNRRTPRCLLFVKRMLSPSKSRFALGVLPRNLLEIRRRTTPSGRESIQSCPSSTSFTKCGRPFFPTAYPTPRISRQAEMGCPALSRLMISNKGFSPMP